MISSFPRRVVLIACAYAALGACIPPPFARLDDILVDNRPAQPEEFGRVKITRAGATQDGAPGMEILKGDTVSTAMDGVAVLTLTAGWEVIVEPGTVANIENPSIFVRWGKLIIKKLQEVKEGLTVNNEFVSAGAEGTVFVFEVSRDGEVQIGVVEGRVVVNSRRRARWNAVTYQAGEAGIVRAGARPSPVRRLDTQAVRAIQQRVVRVDKFRQLRVPAGVLVPVAPTVAPALPPAVVPGAVVVPHQPATQPASLVYGAIGEKWAQLGSAAGPLGPARTAEADAARGGRFNEFQNGFIYWHPSFGAHAVYGLIGVKWNQLGRERGVGYPLTDEQPAHGGGRFNDFENNASIYWHPQIGAHIVYGAIRDKWVSMGRERGKCGYPTSDEYADGRYRRSDFQYGYIRWSPQSGAIVHGCVTVDAGSALAPAR